MVILLSPPVLVLSIVPPLEPVMVLGLVLWLCVFIGGILWWRNQQTTYAIILTTSSGEVTAWQSADDSYCSELLAALNDAIVG